jgi:hypothetical protein
VKNILVLTVSLLAGCSGAAPTLPRTAAPEAPVNPVVTAQASAESRCGAFGTNFDENVACRRADGTLRSFADPQIAWRVRYFVRHLYMPCGEMPTVQEAYVFHTVFEDLAADPNLDDAERTAIRNAMYDEPMHCKG